ncbi:MAG: putative transrane anti-sigma factor [Candidatus Solibacter sp.]|jgi:hypothetical protein|nr:putative transrane anti-sigma factor [Candidatus Solibacter sp.]
MSCQNVQERISLLLDCKLPAGDREHVLAHIQSCGQCGSRFESMQYMRSSLRNLGRPPVPPVLAAQLRVMASHERTRQVARRNLAARVQHWVSLVRLCFDNMMRPFAVPFTGGLLSALVLFSVLVPSLSFRHNFGDEPPTAAFTYPDGRIVGQMEYVRMEPVTAASSSDETVLELVIDPTGRVRDFYVSRGKITADMASVILLSQFTPATILGQPTWGRVKLVYRHNGRSVRS